MEHENHYGDRINELISIFIPPENAAPEQLEEARRNMEKYSDYRTYLSFDMQQLVQNGDEVIKIRLSKMLRKNSGGEGKIPVRSASCKLCTGLPYRTACRTSKKPVDPPGDLRRGLFQDGCGKGGKLH